MKTKPLKTKLLAALLTLCMMLSLVPISAYAEGINYIKNVQVDYTHIDYKAGETPHATASVTAGNCTVAYEYWREIYQKEEGGVWSGTGRYWYSNPDKMASLPADKQITQFEAGHHYSYNIMLVTDSGYFFSDDETVVFVGEYEWGTPGKHTNLEIKEMSTKLYIYSPYSIDIPDNSDTISNVTLSNATLSYNAGDAPKATAEIVDTNCTIEYEYWEQMETNSDGYSVPVAYWYSDEAKNNTVSEDKRITSFEEGKNYMYSIMLRAEDGHSFATTDAGLVMTLNGEPVNSQNITVGQDGSTLFAFALKTIKPTQPVENTINSVTLNDATLSYPPEEAPKATAKIAESDPNYTIKYECWGKREKDANDPLTTVAYWYSDESYYSDGDSRFNTFEKGGRYQYSVRLQARDGYTFDSNLNDENVTLNGSSLPFGSWVNVLDDGKTCLITYGTEMRPGQTVEEIHLDAIINFTAGDKPRFSSGIVDPIVDTDHQRWDANDGSGYGITSSDYWNKRYDGKLITEFEADKSYIYGVYFKISDLGMEEGYRFDKNTKLYINGQEITLTPDQISLDDSGETIWFYNVLTMTPAPAVSWQKIDLVEIDGATITFKDGDKPVFTGKTPENAPYIYQFECWETKDGAGVNSAEFFDNAYEKHITAFKSGETYQYILYLKAKHGYYFTADTKIKINGTLYSYRLVNIDPDYDSSGRMYTFWAYTDLIMTPEASGKVPEYKITEGANNTWTQNSNGTLTFRANGDFSKFTGVKVDGNLISSDKYNAASGSTVITLKNDYLGTLSVGNHTLTVVYSDGECNTEFEIKAASTTPSTKDPGSNKEGTTPGKNKPNTGTTANLNTGDTSNIFLWFALLFVSGGATIGTTVVSRKKYSR